MRMCVWGAEWLIEGGGIKGEGGRLVLGCGGEWVARKPGLNILLSALIPSSYQHLYICLLILPQLPLSIPPSFTLCLTHTNTHTSLSTVSAYF